ncbi:MAG: hypothetical protein BWK79_18690 [Beggiatoa sp. IS2]|nr:MAG: hypothetical protein BWK79_18690 [Beggiatoa sp. IS2]
MINFPFAFAKRHGIILTHVATNSATLFYRPQITSQTIIEVRRYLGIPLKLQAISAEQFEALLTTHYEQQANSSAQMMAGLEDELDLFQVAQQLPEPEDLLENADDAPIIRFVTLPSD